MSTLLTIAECVGKNGKGEKIIAAKRVCELTGSSYGIYVFRENYRSGRMVGKWLLHFKGTRNEVIERFNKIKK